MDKAATTAIAVVGLDRVASSLLLFILKRLQDTINPKYIVEEMPKSYFKTCDW